MLKYIRSLSFLFEFFAWFISAHDKDSITSCQVDFFTATQKPQLALVNRRNFVICAYLLGLYSTKPFKSYRELWKNQWTPVYKVRIYPELLPKGSSNELCMDVSLVISFQVQRGQYIFSFCIIPSIHYKLCLQWCSTNIRRWLLLQQ